LSCSPRMRCGSAAPANARAASVRVAKPERGRMPGSAARGPRRSSPGGRKRKSHSETCNPDGLPLRGKGAARMKGRRSFADSEAAEIGELLAQLKEARRQGDAAGAKRPRGKLPRERQGPRPLSRFPKAGGNPMAGNHENRSNRSQTTGIGIIRQAPEIQKYIPFFRIPGNPAGLADFVRTPFTALASRAKRSLDGP